MSYETGASDNDTICTHTRVVRLDNSYEIDRLRARINEIEAENTKLRTALSSIEVYADDILTGPAGKLDAKAYKSWLREGVREIGNRARAAAMKEGI